MNRGVLIGFAVSYAVTVLLLAGAFLWAHHLPRRFAQHTNVTLLFVAFASLYRGGPYAYHLFSVAASAFFASVMYHGCEAPPHVPADETYALVIAGAAALLVAVVWRTWHSVGRGAALVMAGTGALLVAALAVLLFSRALLHTRDGCARGDPALFAVLDYYLSLGLLIAVTLDLVGYARTGGARHATEWFFYVTALLLVLYVDAGRLTYGRALLVLAALGALVLLTQVLRVALLMDAARRVNWCARYNGYDVAGAVVVGGLAAFVWRHYMGEPAAHGWWHVLASGAAVLAIFATLASAVHNAAARIARDRADARV